MLEFFSVEIPHHELPPTPLRLIGRDQVKAEIIKFVLNSKPVIILGSGGIGKTSLALTVLNDNQVIKVYKDRYFLSCDGVTSFNILLAELAALLRIPLNARDQFIKERILQALRNQSTHSLLCIDNLETLWDISNLRTPIESFLAMVCRISNASVLVTMRGSERPGQVEWAPLHSLAPLDATDTAQVFKDVAGRQHVDEFGKKLLNATGGLPLAVTLLGHLAQVEGETTEDLWNRWLNLGTSFFSRDETDRDRELSLTASIRLSLLSPRLQGESFAPQMLALLAILPDGFSAASDRLDHLQRLLSPEIRI
jgi:hypothetical protein